MTSAAVHIAPNGPTIAIHGPANLLTPHTLGRWLTHNSPERIDETQLYSTGRPAPRGVIDACTWRYIIDRQGNVTAQRPAGQPGRWTTITKENAR